MVQAWPLQPLETHKPAKKPVLYVAQMLTTALETGSKIAYYQKYETQTVESGVVELYFFPIDFFLP